MAIALVSLIGILLYLFLQTTVFVSNVTCFRYTLCVLLKCTRFLETLQLIDITTVLSKCFRPAARDHSWHFLAHQPS